MAVVHTKCHFVPHSYQNATGRASIVGTCQSPEGIPMAPQLVEKVVYVNMDALEEEAAVSF